LQVANILETDAKEVTILFFVYYANSYLNYMQFLIQQGLQTHAKKKFQAGITVKF